MQIRSATVKYRAGDVKKTEFGERQNVVITYADGTEGKLWFKAGREPHVSLQKGQAIQVVIEKRDGKECKKLVKSVVTEPSRSDASQSSPSSPAPVASQRSLSRAEVYEPLSNERKKEIAAYIEEQTKLYKFCLEQALPVVREVDGDLEDARAIATTLFISAQRKFGL